MVYANRAMSAQILLLPLPIFVLVPEMRPCKDLDKEDTVHIEH